MIPEIDIWRVADVMIKRYGESAQAESAKRADQFAEVGDGRGAAIWLRVSRAATELANTTPTGAVH
jgi:hypothetical protein